MQAHPPRPNWRYFKSSPTGTEVVKNELAALGTDPKAALQELMRRRKRADLRPDENKPLGDGLWELRLKLGGESYRLVYSPLGDGLILLALTVLHKKTQKLPARVIKVAKKRRAQWISNGS